MLHLNLSKKKGWLWPPNNKNTTLSKQPVEIAKSYARSAAEGYPTGVMKDTYKAIVAMVDEIEESDD